MADDDTRATELDSLVFEQLSDKWTLIVLHAFCGGPGDETVHRVRFNAIKRATAGISQKTLTSCLRRLERNGILRREILPGSPPGVAYSITTLGLSLAEPMTAMRRWAAAHLDDVREARAAFDDAQTPRTAAAT